MLDFSILGLCPIKIYCILNPAKQCYNYLRYINFVDNKFELFKLFGAFIMIKHYQIFMQVNYLNSKDDKSIPFMKSYTLFLKCFVKVQKNQ